MSDRRIDYMSLDELVPATRNPKRHALDVLDDSVIRFGFTEPPMIDERTGKLIAGHGRIDTLKIQRDRGSSPPPGIKVDGTLWLVPIIRGWSSQNDDEANGYLVASNRPVELGGWDNGELLALLTSLDDLEGIGYQLEDLDKLAIQNAVEQDKPKSPKPVKYEVIIDCDSALHQTEVIALLQSEGLNARAK